MAKPVSIPAVKKSVDWSAVHERLARASAHSAPDSGAQRTHDAEILARRARALAQPPARANLSPDDLLNVVRFELGGQLLALEAGVVRETVLLRDITPLPGLPPFVRGLANVRSRVLPVFDLRPLLQLPARTAATHAEKLLIVAWDGADFSLLADEVTGSGSLALGGLRRDVPGLNQKYLRGLSADGHLLLDLATLFPDLRVGDGDSL